MDLTARFIEAHDFPACVELLRGHLAYPGELLVDHGRLGREVQPRRLARRG